MSNNYRPGYQKCAVCLKGNARIPYKKCFTCNQVSQSNANIKTVVEENKNGITLNGIYVEDYIPPTRMLKREPFNLSGKQDTAFDRYTTSSQQQSCDSAWPYKGYGDNQ